MTSKTRTAKADVAAARVRFRAAQAYHEVSELVLGETDRDEYLNVAAGLAVLAGIAASDAICARRLGVIHRGDDHRRAAELLRGATTDGAKLASTFQRLLDIKDEAHYGVIIVSARKARDAVRWAGQLVARARNEIER